MVLIRHHLKSLDILEAFSFGAKPQCVRASCLGSEVVGSGKPQGNRGQQARQFQDLVHAHHVNAVVDGTSQF